MPAHWLFKSEPHVFSFADLRGRPGQTEPWTGVRNYQARNFLRDQVAVGDQVLFYHSSCPHPGLPGLARVVRGAFPDPTAADPASPYFDPRSDPRAPRWVAVEVAWEADFPHYVRLAQLRADPRLDGLALLRRGQRLSIQPVAPGHFAVICALGGVDPHSLRE